MRSTLLFCGFLCLAGLSATWLGFSATTSSHWTVVAWNDLGMHCVDGNDYSVFSILPPYNNVHAQVIDASGKLVKSGSNVRLTYEAVADPAGSINRSSKSKTNFWQYVFPLFGVTLAPDAGLAGQSMPGTANKPQPMKWDTAHSWFGAEGIPILPYDDAGNKNYYPMMKVVARNSKGSVLASTSIVLPVSDEMDCSACHASGSTSTAAPQKGWVFDPNPTRDYKLNILRLHDERRPVPSAMLTGAGYKAAGLEATAIAGSPVLCAKCHGSNALPGTGIQGVKPLTAAVHALHAGVIDPTNNQVLNDVANRSSCYRCHPGSTTKCLRGVMGNATAPDGSMLMQCQSCHGTMSQVGSLARQGWFEEPNCQSCHTGTAVQNNGQIRYTSVFDTSGQMRQAVNLTFATNPNTPASGLSLYRFSRGHGGLQCEACHGSTHAEYPSSHANDNLQSQALQGHSGTLIECTACHGSQTLSATGGPHGMHPVGASWVGQHGDLAEGGRATQCQTCHGTDYRGTVLSQAKANRSFRVEDRTVQIAMGTAIGCYTCHNGPRGGD
jgi:hypothetical protein